MVSLELFIPGQTISALSLSKSLSLFAPKLRHSSFSPSSRALSPSPLYLRASLPSLPRCASRESADDSAEDDEEVSFEEELVLEDEAEAEEEGDEDFGAMIDVEALEAEAREVVREYSTSLSSQLIIGVFYLQFLTL